jgi:hypothetical protein
MKNEEKRIIKEIEGAFLTLKCRIEEITEKCCDLNRDTLDFKINKLMELAKPFKNTNPLLYLCVNGIVLECKLKQEEEESY